jgi:hypothetical protein
MGNPHHDGQLIHPSTPISPFEQYLIAKMRFKKEYGYSFLGTLFARGRRVIGWYVNRRAVEWGEAGQDITILDLTLEYLAADMPQEYKDSGFDDVGLLVDGKDNNCDTIRKDSSLSRAQYSSKKSCSYVTDLARSSFLRGGRSGGRRGGRAD